jgi:hypothetical protein
MHGNEAQRVPHAMAGDLEHQMMEVRRNCNVPQAVRTPNMNIEPEQ